MESQFILICISVIAKRVDYFSCNYWLLALLTLFSNLLIGLLSIFRCLIFFDVVYIFCIFSLADEHLAKVFLQLVGNLFMLVIISFAMQKPFKFNFDVVSRTIHTFRCQAVRVIFRKFLPLPISLFLFVFRTHYFTFCSAAWIALNSLQFSCLRLLNAGIIGMFLCAQMYIYNFTWFLCFFWCKFQAFKFYIKALGPFWLV